MLEAGQNLMKATLAPQPQRGDPIKALGEPMRALRAWVLSRVDVRMIPRPSGPVRHTSVPRRGRIVPRLGFGLVTPPTGGIRVPRPMFCRL